jgi:predicted TIM-barrel enzyme
LIVTKQLTDRVAQHIADQVVRMEQAIDRNDCWLAIGTAKELVETACKTILSELGVSFGGNADLMDLYKLVRKELKLLPEDISDAAKASATIKNILSNLATIVQVFRNSAILTGLGTGQKVEPRGLSRDMQSLPWARPQPS